MKKAHYIPIGHLLSLFFLVLSSGCSLTQFKVINGTESNVFVTSSHTGEILNIGKGRSKVMKHTYGDMYVEYVDGAKLTYKSVSPLSFRKTKYSEFTDFFFKTSITVTILIHKDRLIYVLPAGTEELGAGSEEGVDQPTGFPVHPSLGE